MKKTFVLDTNVLIHDPTSLFKFGEHDIVVPFTVIGELDRHKRGRGEIAKSARQVLRTIDELREGGSLSSGVRIPSGSTIAVSLPSGNGHLMQQSCIEWSLSRTRLTDARNRQEDVRVPL